MTPLAFDVVAMNAREFFIDFTTTCSSSVDDILFIESLQNDLVDCFGDRCTIYLTHVANTQVWSIVVVLPNPTWLTKFANIADEFARRCELRVTRCGIATTTTNHTSSNKYRVDIRHGVCDIISL